MNQSPYSVLVVEDERWVRVVLREVLRETGLPFRIVQECTHGLEALDWLQSHTADIVLADVKMPVMDGVSFIERLAGLKESPSVVFISGYDDFQAARKALRCGVIDYLMKPVAAEELSLALGKWMKDREKKREIAQASSSAGAEEGHSEIMEQVLRLIHERPGHVSLAGLAAQVHMNASYLSQYFKQHTGRNFTDYVAGLRLEEAKMLIARTSLRISEIAERLGYSDIAYFSSTFKKTTGKSPLDFRRQEQVQRN
ncbi:response regulator [Paenibacillus sp. BK720]|uniref:response regulator transcription factor n=1 Tax=Paenibacillus sp. BK720 TaxID=2587092 RepID=UPI00142328D6|nr:response regulator [Paenibacillus sp. BK720]NIK70827.1 YesN/AraC family two-component response regulator [Paenibacillus sp. BK720]